MSPSRAVNKRPPVGPDNPPPTANSLSHQYSQELSKEAIDILATGCRTPVRAAPTGLRHQVPAPSARTFAPLWSPLEHLVPYTPNTTLVEPVVAEHLNPNLVTSPAVYKKHQHTSGNSFSKVVKRVINAIHPPLSKDAKLIKSTPIEIVDYLAEQRSQPWEPEIHFGGISNEGKKQTMLVFDVFTTENRALKAFAIGPSPESPLYIYYPLRHPYDQAFIETLANRGEGISPYPVSSMPDPDVDNLGAQSGIAPETAKNKKTSIWMKVINKLSQITEPKSRKKSTSIPLHNIRPVTPTTVAPEQVFTYPLSQSFLQYRDPLTASKSVTVSGMRWSSVWINNRFHNCMEEDSGTAPKPTEQELTEVAHRTIRIACYEARVAKLKGIKRWYFKMVHRRSAYRRVRIIGKTVDCQESGGTGCAQAQAQSDSKDAGAIYVDPDVTTLQDTRVANHIFPTLSATRKGIPDRATPDSGYSSPSRIITNMNPLHTTFQNRNQLDIVPERKHPIENREIVFDSSFRRRPQTIYDLEDLTNKGLPLQLPTLNLGECNPQNEYVIADEFVSFRQCMNPNQLATEEPGIQIFYDPPKIRTEAEKKRSGVEYVSGRYLWVYKRNAWAVKYERRMPTKAESREIMKMKKAEIKEMNTAKKTWGIGADREKMEELLKQQKHARGPSKNFGRVMLYPPAGSGDELLGYLDLEKGQLSIRGDVNIGELHIAVLAMFSVVSFEEAVYEEQKLHKSLHQAKGLTSAEIRPVGVNQQLGASLTRPEEPVQASPKAPSPRTERLQTHELESQLRPTKVTRNSETQTTPPSVTKDNQIDVESDCDSESDTDSDGIQEIVHRNSSSAWVRCEDAPYN